MGDRRIVWMNEWVDVCVDGQVREIVGGCSDSSCMTDDFMLCRNVPASR